MDKTSARYRRNLRLFWVFTLASMAAMVWAAIGLFMMDAGAAIGGWLICALLAFVASFFRTANMTREEIDRELRLKKEADRALQRRRQGTWFP